MQKDDLRIQTYGTLDELNAVLGVVLSESSLPEGSRKSLLRLQGELFQLGAELATPSGKRSHSKLVDAEEIQALENEIDAMETELSPLQTFILPGGTKEASFVHLARTVSRRAERELVGLNRREAVRPAVLQYLNRLSDYLFVMARWINHVSRVSDVPWVAPR